ncbi:uncharacterized protein LOC141854187 [Brevipalpus obovatus]|uniref:uncharacterized protein LOC141854187 n=1 Tax=Brevipalpus obovatus TaxID=246614 RepID=UPI003D9DB17F
MPNANSSPENDLQKDDKEAISVKYDFSTKDPDEMSPSINSDTGITQPMIEEPKKGILSDGQGESSASSEESKDNESPKDDNVKETQNVREDLIATAVEFLRLPKVSLSSMDKKRAFLKSKGLTEKEITVAFYRVENQSQTPGSSNPMDQFPSSSSSENPFSLKQANAFVEPQYTHRPEERSFLSRFTYSTFFISAFCYGTYWLYQKFLEPAIVRFISEKLGSIERRLEDLTASVKNTETKGQTTQELMESLTAKTSSDLAQSHEINELRAELTSIKNMVSKSSNNAHTGLAISELKNEIAGFREILLKRVPGATLPSWQLESSSATTTTEVATSSQNSQAQSTTSIKPENGKEKEIDSSKSESNEIKKEIDSSKSESNGIEKEAESSKSESNGIEKEAESSVPESNGHASTNGTKSSPNSVKNSKKAKNR